MRSSLHFTDVHASAESHTLAKLIMSVSFITTTLIPYLYIFFAWLVPAVKKHLQLCLALLLQALCKGEETDYWTALHKRVKHKDNKQAVTLTYVEI